MFENYERFSQGQKDTFRDICNKLMVNTFLTRDKDNNKTDYYFVINFKDVFDEFLAVLGYELEVDTTQGVVMLAGASANQSVKFKRDETIILLILRLLYHEKMKETSLNEHIIIGVDDIHQKYNYLEIKKRINKTDLVNSLRQFKRFNIIETLGDVQSSAVKIVIFPTILFAIKTQEITEVNQFIQKLNEEASDSND